MRIAIIEDDESQSRNLENMFQHYAVDNGLTIETVTFTNAEDFIDGYKGEYDIVCMDIELPGMNGMDAALQLREKDRDVILYFITNMAQYALKGYEAGAIDFMVKPVSYPQLGMKLERAMVELKRNNSKKIAIKHKEGVVYVAIKDIYYIEAMGHHISYHTIYGDYEVYGTFKSVVASTADPLLVQCNRFYLVNLRYVEEIRDRSVKIKNSYLQISRAKYQDFLLAVNAYMGGQI